MSPRRAAGLRRLSTALVCLVVLVSGAGCRAAPPPPIHVSIEPGALHTNSRAEARVTPAQVVEEELVFSYQWLRNGAPIAGATSAFLDLSDSTRGARGDAISVEVVAQRGDARGTPARSVPITVAPLIAIDVRESKSFYPVEGTTTASILASIRRNAPRDGERVAFGQARFSSAPIEFQAVRTGEGCALDWMTVQNDVLVVLPAPIDSPLPSALQARYQRFRDNVAVHEARHVEIRRVHLEALAQTLRALGPSATCEALKAEVDRVIGHALEVEQADQDRFHEEDEARVEAACAPIAAQMDAMASTLAAARSQPARYNALLPAYRDLVDDHQWCVRS